MCLEMVRAWGAEELSLGVLNEVSKLEGSAPLRPILYSLSGRSKKGRGRGKGEKGEREKGFSYFLSLSFQSPPFPSSLSPTRLLRKLDPLSVTIYYYYFFNRKGTLFIYLLLTNDLFHIQSNPHVRPPPAGDQLL